MSFGINAAMSGKAVFYASCEVSKEILSDRADSNISGIPFERLNDDPAKVALEVEDAWDRTTGFMTVEDFGAGELKVSELNRVLDQYAQRGTMFDLVIIDYIDEMAPEVKDTDRRHDLASITRGLRALARSMDVAILTATQTNRAGSKNARRDITSSEDVAEDYNKVRIADAIITINRSEEDMDAGEVVLYWADMRNARSNRRFRLKQQLECFRFIESYIGEDT